MAGVKLPQIGRFEDVGVKTDIEATASGRAWLAV